MSSFDRNEYPDGVVLFKTLPYRVACDSEVCQIIRSLLSSKKNLSLVNPYVAGDLTRRVKDFSHPYPDLYEAFVHAFYEDVPGVYLPREFTSMETAAWLMAENAFAYHKALFGELAGKCVSKKAYDEAIKLLNLYWGQGKTRWEDVVRAFWFLCN